MKNKIKINFNSRQAKELSGILNSEICNKIFKLLIKGEYSESDISKELKLPLNTIEYNLNKLLKVGLIKEAKNFFWKLLF